MGARLARAIPILVGLIVGVAAPSTTAPSEWPRVAIGGYDPVAYFTYGHAARGNQEYVFAWRDAIYMFSTPAHRDAFVAAPDRYAPQFDGYCVLGMLDGMKLSGDPEAWIIVNGKLYLTYDKAMRDRLLADPKSLIQLAEAKWAALAH